jgi:hypothetical protein
MAIVLDDLGHAADRRSGYWHAGEHRLNQRKPPGRTQKQDSAAARVVATQKLSCQIDMAAEPPPR